MIKVCKFGGTSMADGNVILAVSKIVEADAQRKYVVVSAPGKRFSGDIKVTDFDFVRDEDNVKINITFMKDGVETEMEADGNGSLSAINNALKAYTGKEYVLQVFTQHSMQGQGSRSVAASYIGLEGEDGVLYWGAGTHTDVIKASTKALLSAFHNMTKGGK